MKMGVTFDTNALLSSTLWDGSVAQKLLFCLIRKEIGLFTTSAILLEYQNVLKRDFGYSDEEVAKIIEKILSTFKLIVPKEKIIIVKDDPDDNKIIECAVESKSKYIITYDQHLLKIGGYNGIRIVKPEKAMDLFECR